MRYEDNPIVGYYNNGMAVPVAAGKNVIKPIHLFDYDGRRIYRHSLCYLLCYASYLAFKDRSIRIGHSLGDGFYFTFKDEKPVSEEEIEILRKTMKDLVSEALPIEFTKLSYDDALEKFKNEGMYSTALLLEFKNEPEINVYRIKDYSDVAYEPIVPDTSVLSVWELRRYSDKGFLLRYPVSKDIKHIREFKDNPGLFKVFDEYKHWGKLLKVSCAGELNGIISDCNISRYVRLSEALHRRKLAEVADMIVNRRSSAVFISGPSSSGKTTFSLKLCEQLMLMGYSPIKISLDNYYKPKNEIPLDENGEKDFECLEALKLDLFEENIKDLYSGKAVSLPLWSFAKQERSFETPVVMDKNTILVIEGIHALNPEVSGFVEKKFLFRIYISALTQLNLDDHNRISTTDNRILRRILRDYRTRNTSAEETFNMWESVEKGERKHIFSYQNNADINFNSAFDYELGVIAPKVIPLLKAIKPDAGRAYTMARRLLTFLDNFYPISDSLVPSDSILREFIGGSDYGNV